MISRPFDHSEPKSVLQTEKELFPYNFPAFSAIALVDDHVAFELAVPVVSDTLQNPLPPLLNNDRKHQPQFLETKTESFVSISFSSIHANV